MLPFRGHPFPKPQSPDTPAVRAHYHAYGKCPSRRCQESAKYRRYHEEVHDCPCRRVPRRIRRKEHADDPRNDTHCQADDQHSNRKHADPHNARTRAAPGGFSQPDQDDTATVTVCTGLPDSNSNGRGSTTRAPTRLDRLCSCAFPVDADFAGSAHQVDLREQARFAAATPVCLATSNLAKSDSANRLPLNPSRSRVG